MDTAIESRPVIAMDAVVSRQISKIGYDATTKTLAVQFAPKPNGNHGSVYHYSQVSDEDFAAFKSAESIGKHFYKHIKPFDEKYPYEKIS